MKQTFQRVKSRDLLGERKNRGLRLQFDPTVLQDFRAGGNIRHTMTALLRQAVFGRLAVYEDTNDAERLRADPMQLFSLAYNAGNFLRTLALPRKVSQWTLTTIRKKLIKIGAKVVRHAKYVTFQLAEVAIPRNLFAMILDKIAQLRLEPETG